MGARVFRPRVAVMPQGQQLTVQQLAALLDSDAFNLSVVMLAVIRTARQTAALAAAALQLGVPQ